ncbi:periplasmic heavy metal sensor [Ruegeria pomeroyi]|uniref:Uncharacterized protein n=2 Tax=Ruegeria pomeroyi TaxID=89184 RepID=Q5LPU5_RUEPO|nr:periplasmic heavy metal sensor [Ruegeria pomeroyi]HCE70659.1 hypothetical protein [Ruegeria sp.]AAV95995.1 hypothetical protein SPO2754 [Ruegeria pomeroyi DSS-3]NVK97645.1 periplasmic heavy metal sensor [Ruegeria pomeroyi]NVL01347.1 periplasmic heavy metal sensor [Ruegeria pomeroyi]QWV09557.1 periplasmic heavy metal sensor [Ruegeria pomeroyi]
MSEEKKTLGWPLRLLLLGSLALNLLVIGLAAGAMWRYGGDHGHRPPLPMAATLYRALPEADRDQLRQHIHGRLDGRKARRAQEMAELAAALRASPFDPAQFAALLATHETRRAESHGAMRAALIDRIASMDQGTRAAYADRIERMRMHGFPRRERN